MYEQKASTILGFEGPSVIRARCVYVGGASRPLGEVFMLDETISNADTTTTIIGVNGSSEVNLLTPQTSLDRGLYARFCVASSDVGALADMPAEYTFRGRVQAFVEDGVVVGDALCGGTNTRILQIATGFAGGRKVIAIAKEANSSGGNALRLVDFCGIGPGFGMDLAT
jgi:hypothetical protein